MRTSTELTIEHMAGRLERVERSCRRWKLLNLTMATIFFSILMMGGRRADDPQGTVEAERFVLKDKNGRLRGEWTTFADEKSDVETGLRLLDRDGNARIQLWVLGGEGKHADTPLIT
ncbi:MAG TPA: hypothetical protein VFT74_11435, partial [Isosphaeraceae bacterium]|nr:hypothetical protein [Isosphaeraceae bacterium]